MPVLPVARRITTQPPRPQRLTMVHLVLLLRTSIFRVITVICLKQRMMSWICSNNLCGLLDCYDDAGSIVILADEKNYYVLRFSKVTHVFFFTSL